MLARFSKSKKTEARIGFEGKQTSFSALTHGDSITSTEETELKRIVALALRHSLTTGHLPTKYGPHVVLLESSMKQ